MPQLEFFVPMIPVAKGRARVTKKGFAYTPAKTRAAEKMFAQCAFEYAPEKQITGPIQAELFFLMPIPASTKKQTRYEMETGNVRHIKRPDVDNIAKLVLDALGDTGAFWFDDAQIADLRCTKRYNKTPGVAVKLTWWEQ